jgi:long-subunit fatty acid transport protein
MRAIGVLLTVVMLCNWLWASSGIAQDLGALGITLPPSLNFAVSPSPIGSGARAAGKATAFIGVADDATAASHNPGGLIQLERPEFSVVGSYFVRFEDQDVTQLDTIVEGQTLDSFDLNYLSLAYPFQLLRRNVVVSLNIQRLFDLQGATDVISRFDDIDGVQQVRSRQEGGLFTISPAMAVQIIPAFSVGMALNIWPRILGNGWEQDVDVSAQGRVVVGNRIVPFTSTGRIKEEFDFAGFNVTVGFLWHLNPMFTLGGVFRSPFTAKVKHRHASSLNVTFEPGTANATTASSDLEFSDTLDMDMPMSYGLGLSARLSDSLTLSLDVARVHWSDFKLEESTQDDVLLVENGAPAGKGEGVLRGRSDDTTSVRLGAEYLWIRSQYALPLRAGVFYDPEPSDGGTDDFYGFSLGSGLAIRSFLFDVAYTFRTGKVESEATDTTIHQHKILASVIYHF